MTTYSIRDMNTVKEDFTDYSDFSKYIVDVYPGVYIPNIPGFYREKVDGKYIFFYILDKYLQAGIPRPSDGSDYSELRIQLTKEFRIPITWRALAKLQIDNSTFFLVNGDLFVNGSFVDKTQEKIRVGNKIIRVSTLINRLIKEGELIRDEEKESNN